MRGSESIRETRESQRGKGGIIGMSVMRENKTSSLGILTKHHLPLILGNKIKKAFFLDQIFCLSHLGCLPGPITNSAFVSASLELIKTTIINSLFLSWLKIT